MREVIKILAMDLSLNLPAFAVCEVVDGRLSIKALYHCDNKKPAKMTHAEKLERVRWTISEIQGQHGAFDYICRERGFSRFNKTTQGLYKVVGMSDWACYQYLNKTEIYEYPPTTVKQALCGTGKASKEEVEEAVRERLKQVEQDDYEFYSDDESDAVAVAFCHAEHLNLLKRVRKVVDY